MADEMHVSMPEGVLRPIIQAQVVAALQGQERLISELVSFVLNQKVRDQSTYKEYSFLELTARNLIREAVAESVREWLAAQRGPIQAAVEKQLRGQARGIATRLVATVADNAASQWQLKIDVKLGE